MTLRTLVLLGCAAALTVPLAGCGRLGDLEKPSALNGADRATVTFRQNYRSDVLKSNNRKTLVMVRSGGQWQILEEKSG